MNSWSSLHVSCMMASCGFVDPQEGAKEKFRFGLLDNGDRLAFVDSPQNEHKPAPIALTAACFNACSLAFAVHLYYQQGVVSYLKSRHENQAVEWSSTEKRLGRVSFPCRAASFPTLTIRPSSFCLPLASSFFIFLGLGCGQLTSDFLNTVDRQGRKRYLAS